MGLISTRIVLINTSHPGNIGAAARAMKNMGLSELYLLAPAKFPDSQAFAMASGADDILENAVVVNSLDDALVGCDLIYGTSARHRTIDKPILTPDECATTIMQQCEYKAAILFGRECSGLRNNELAVCHSHIVIPTNADFSSLNLAAAVQIVTYELRCAFIKYNDIVTSKPADRKLASAEQVLSFYSHLQSALISIKFLNPNQPKMLMQRLQRLFNRALLDETEVNILHGILSNIDKITNHKKDDL